MRESVDSPSSLLIQYPILKGKPLTGKLAVYQGRTAAEAGLIFGKIMGFRKTL